MKLLRGQGNASFHYSAFCPGWNRCLPLDTLRATQIRLFLVIVRGEMDVV